jgi:hypothetical protein
MGRVLSAGAAGQKREGKRAGAGAGHGGGEVAVGRSSGGRGTRGRGQHGRGAGPGKGEGYAWSGQELEVAPGTAGARHMAGEGGGVRREAEQSRAELEVEDRDALVIFQKYRDSTVNSS